MMRSLLLIMLSFIAPMLNELLAEVNIQKEWSVKAPATIVHHKASLTEDILWAYMTNQKLYKYNLNNGQTSSILSNNIGPQCSVNKSCTEALSNRKRINLNNGNIIGEGAGHFIDDAEADVTISGQVSNKYCNFTVYNTRSSNPIYVRNNFAGFPLSASLDEEGNGIAIDLHKRCTWPQEASSSSESTMTRLRYYESFSETHSVYIDSIASEFKTLARQSAEIHVTAHSYFINTEDNLYVLNRSDSSTVRYTNALYQPDQRIIIQKMASDTLILFNEFGYKIGESYIYGISKKNIYRAKNGLIALSDSISFYKIEYDDITNSVFHDIIVSKGKNIRLSHSFSSDAEFHWDFGDGSKSFEYIPSKSYSQTGRFSIALRVINKGVEYTYLDSVDVVANFDSVFQIPSATTTRTGITLNTPIINGYEKLTWLVDSTEAGVGNEFDFISTEEGIYKITLIKQVRDSTRVDSAVIRVTNVNNTITNIEDMLEYHEVITTRFTDVAAEKRTHTSINRLKINTLIYDKGRYYLDLLQTRYEGGYVSTGTSSFDYVEYDQKYNYLVEAAGDKTIKLAIQTNVYDHVSENIYDYDVYEIKQDAFIVTYNSQPLYGNKYVIKVGIPIGYDSLYFPVTFPTDSSTYIFTSSKDGLAELKRVDSSDFIFITRHDLHFDEIIPGSYTFFHQNAYTGILFRMTDGRIFAHTMQDVYTLSPPTVIVPDTDKGELIGYEPLLNGLILRYRNKGRNYEYRHRMGIEDGQVLFSEPWVYDITDYPVWIDGYYYDIHQLPNAVDSSLIMTEIRIYDSTHTHVHSYLPPQVYVPTEQLLADIDGKFYINSPDSFTELGNIFPLQANITKRTDDRKWDMSYLSAENKHTDVRRFSPYSRDGRINVPGLRPDAGFEIYDLAGRQVSPERQLSPGCYLVRIEGVTYKVMVE